MKRKPRIPSTAADGQPYAPPGADRYPQCSSAEQRRAMREMVYSEEKEEADIEAQRLEVYEGGPLPDANFFEHDPFCYDGPDED